jgi:hypothetical protein
MNAGRCIENTSFLNSALDLCRALWAQAKCTGSLKSWPVCQTFFLVVCIVCVCAKLFLAQARPGVLFLAASGLPRKWCPNWRLGQSWGRFVFLPEVTRNFFGPPQTQSNPQNAHEYIVSIVDVGHWSIENLNLDFCSLFFYLCLLPKPQLLFSTIFAYSFGLYTRNLTNGVWRMA